MPDLPPLTLYLAAPNTAALTLAAASISHAIRRPPSLLPSVAWSDLTGDNEDDLEADSTGDRVGENGGVWLVV